MEQKKELSKKEIEAWVKEYFNADYCIGPTKWKGYDVYEPGYNKLCFLFGLYNPAMLVKGNEMRPGTHEEGLEFGLFQNGDDTDELDDNIDEPMEKDNTLSGNGE